MLKIAHFGVRKMTNASTGAMSFFGGSMQQIINFMPISDFSYAVCEIRFLVEIPFFLKSVLFVHTINLYFS